MQLHPTTVHGAYRITREKHTDHRGFFARFFCQHTFAEHGLATNYVQINHSLNERKGTLRGMHYQLPPAADAKLISPMQGVMYDVIVDLRPDSPTFRQTFGTELHAADSHMMYVPAGCAHGFITLTDQVELLYVVSQFHTPERERGLRYNDPQFAIDWPITPTCISDKDQHWPDFDTKFHGIEEMRGLL